MDAYALKARHGPALIAGLPGAFLMLAGAFSPAQGGKVVGIAGGAVLFLAGQLVRDQGRRLQAELWRRWGGNPTSRRLQDEPNNAELRARVEAVTGVQLPTQADETQDSGRAERQRDLAVASLRERTREHKVLLAENINYGFRRNLLGLRRLGRLLATVALSISVAALIVGNGSWDQRAATWGLSALGCLVMLVFWRRVVTERWVRTAAEIYADQLLAATHALPREGH
jgi:hypothetical protein